MPTGFAPLHTQAKKLADRFSLSASHYDETSNFPFVNFDALFEADLLRLTQGSDTGGLGFGLAVRTGRLSWAPVGFAIAVGWALLSLHNDCRYKAFFQRLKSSRERYRVEGGAGGRPAPPPSWPRRGRAAITYPLYKACEPHVVLLGLTGLAALAIVDPRVWQACWAASALATAVTAPLLGAARVARSISRASTEAEFRAWFRPMGEFVASAGDAKVVSRHLPLDTACDVVVSPSAVDRSNEAA